MASTFPKAFNGHVSNYKAVYLGDTRLAHKPTSPIVNFSDGFYVSPFEMRSMVTSEKFENYITPSKTFLLEKLQNEVGGEYDVTTPAGAYAIKQDLFYAVFRFQAAIAIRLSPYLASQNTQFKIHPSLDPIGYPKTDYYKAKFKDSVYREFYGATFSICALKIHKSMVRYLPNPKVFKLTLEILRKYRTRFDTISLSIMPDGCMPSLTVSYNLSGRYSDSVKLYSGCRFVAEAYTHPNTDTLSVAEFKELFKERHKQYRFYTERELTDVSEVQ